MYNDKRELLVLGRNDHLTADCFDFKGFDTSREIGICDYKCGYGKSTFATRLHDGLLDTVNSQLDRNINPNQTMIIEPRKQLQTQQLDDNPTTLSRIDSLEGVGDEPAFGTLPNAGKIGSMTFHMFGRRLFEGDLPTHLRLLVIDEFHLLFHDTYVHQWYASIKEWLPQFMAHGGIVIGLTATPEPLEWLSTDNWFAEGCQYECERQFGFRFRNIARYRTMPKYRYSGIEVFSHMGIESAFRKFRGTEQSKTLFHAYEAKKAHDIGVRNTDTLFIISANNKKRDDSGELLAEHMDNESIDALSQSKEFPEGINNVIGTSVIKQGLNIMDDSIGTIVVEDYTPDGIIQSLQRVRADGRKAKVLVNATQYRLFEKQSCAYFDSDFMPRYRKQTTEEARQLLLEEQWKAQESKDDGHSEHSDIPCFVFKSFDGTFKIDWSVLCMWRYQKACFHWATNEIEPTMKAYFERMFDGYTDNLEFSVWSKNKTKESKDREDKRELQERIAKVAPRYIGRHLYTSDKNILCDEVGVKWPTIKGLLSAIGYTVKEDDSTREYVDGKRARYSLISMGQKS